MALSTSSIAVKSELLNVYDNSSSTGDFEKKLASEYDSYAKAGVVPGATTGGEDPSIIEDGLKAIKTDALAGNQSSAILTLATAFANYWATAHIMPGAPAHGGISVIDVVNDAAGKVSLFVSAITTALTTAAPGEESPIIWLADNIQSIAVSQIIWTVTEQMPPPAGPASFPEPIS